MRLIDPKGVRISVSDELGEKLLKLAGYRRIDVPMGTVVGASAPTGPPVSDSPPRRTRKTPKDK